MSQALFIGSAGQWEVLCLRQAKLRSAALCFSAW